MQTSNDEKSKIKDPSNKKKHKKQAGTERREQKQSGISKGIQREFRINSNKKEVDQPQSIMIDTIVVLES
jgi:hypothetical protein